MKLRSNAAKVLAVLLWGCGDPSWVDSPPIRVALISATDLDACELATAEAVEAWNTAAGGELFRYIGRRDAEADRRVNVRCEPGELDQGAAGWTHWVADDGELTRLTVELSEAHDMRVVAIHELGHCIGLADEDEDGSAMSWRGSTDVISGDDARYAADIVNGTPQGPEVL